MAFAGILLGVAGGLLAAVAALVFGAGWAVALGLYVLGGSALAFGLTTMAALGVIPRARGLDTAAQRAGY